MDKKLSQGQKFLIGIVVALLIVLGLGLRAILR